MVETGERFQVGDTTFEWVNFFKPNEVFIEGTEMVSRAVALGAILGGDYVRSILDHSNMIPESYNEYDIVFAGARLNTMTRGLGYGHHCEFIAYLRKIRGLWRLCYGSVAFDWDLRTRLLRRFHS